MIRELQQSGFGNLIIPQGFGIDNRLESRFGMHRRPVGNLPSRGKRGYRCNVHGNRNEAILRFGMATPITLLEIPQTAIINKAVFRTFAHLSSFPDTFMELASNSVSAQCAVRPIFSEPMPAPIQWRLLPPHPTTRSNSSKH